MSAEADDGPRYRVRPEALARPLQVVGESPAVQVAVRPAPDGNGVEVVATVQYYAVSRVRLEDAVNEETLARLALETVARLKEGLKADLWPEDQPRSRIIA